MTQRRLGELCGVSQPTVSGWLAGESDPSVENLKKLSGITGLSIDELVSNIAPLPRAQPQAASAP